MAVPSAPTGLYAMPSKLSVALFWDMPSEAVTGYQVYWDTDIGWVNINEPLRVRYVIRDLEVGTTYQCSLRAVNADGVSPYVTVSGTPQVTRPDVTGQNQHLVDWDGTSFDDSTTSNLSETFSPFISANQNDVGNLIVMFLYATGRESNWSGDDNIDTPTGWTKIRSSQRGSNEFIWQGCYARFWTADADTTPTWSTDPAEGLDWVASYSWYQHVESSSISNAQSSRRDQANDGDAPYETTALTTTRGGGYMLYSALWDDQEVTRSLLDDGQKTGQTEQVLVDFAARSGVHNGIQPVSFRAPATVTTGPQETAEFTRPGDENEEIITFTVAIYPQTNSNADLAQLIARSTISGSPFINRQENDGSDIGGSPQSATVTKPNPNVYISLGGGIDALPSVTINGSDASIGVWNDSGFGQFGDRNGPYSLALGANVITIQVTASDGTDRDPYILNIYRQGNISTFLNSFTTTANNLSPAYSNNIYAYTADVSLDTSSFTVTAELGSSGTPLPTITIDGVVTDSEEESADISIAKGERKTVTIVIQPEEPNVTRTITLSVTRPADTNANLQTLAVASWFPLA